MVTVARVLRMRASKPAGCRFEETAMERFFVGGVKEAIEALGCVSSDFEQPDVIDHDEVREEDTGDDAVHGVVGAVGADQGPEVLEPEPSDPHPALHDLLTEGLEKEGLPGTGRPANDDVPLPADPFQGPQRALRRDRDQ